MTDLIIFDCDGTIVESETLYNSVISEFLTKAGLPEYTVERCLHDFTGITFSDIRTLVETRHDMDLSESMDPARYVARAQELMDMTIEPIVGAADLLSTLRGQIKICVGSNGERSSVIKSLKLTGLYEYFGGTDETIFTKIQVARAKPAPDLFLFAAEQMGAAPHNTIVIEDSTAGVRAGIAAGMHVIGFTGSHNSPDQHAKTLAEAGAHQCVSQLIHISEQLAEQKRFAT